MAEHKKVVYISLTNGAGGAEQILLMAARVTQSKLVFLKQVSDFSLKMGADDQEVKYLNRHSISFGFLLLLKELYQYRKGYIIISSHPYLNAYLGILKRLGYLRSKLVSRECTSVFLRYSGLKLLSYKLLYYLGYPAINLFICQTNEMKVQLLKNLSFLKNQRVIVLPNPVDLGSVLSNSAEEVNDPVLKERFICSAGRLIPIKGYDTLIYAFAEIAGDHPDLKLLILGEGPEREKLQKLISSLSLQERIMLKGFVGNPYPYFKHAAVCVVSSIREGFPNVLLQMMALNQSVVSSLCADGIASFQSVCVVPVNNIQEMAEALQNELKTSSSKTSNENFKYLLKRSPNYFINSILSRI